MWWGIGGLYVVIWFVLMVWLGLRTPRNGHGWLFFFGSSSRFCGSSAHSCDRRTRRTDRHLSAPP